LVASCLSGPHPIAADPAFERITQITTKPDRQDATSCSIWTLSYAGKTSTHRSKLILMAGLLAPLAAICLTMPNDFPLSTSLHSKGAEAVALILIVGFALVVRRRA
jgi:hypothetical protein